MKRIIALLLILSMLLCSMTYIASAKRVVTERVSKNNVWVFPAGQTYNPVNIRQSGRFDVAMDIRLDDPNSSLKGWAGIAVGPYVGPDGVGVDNSDFPMAIEVGTWYSIQWNVTDDGTAIYVDDEYVGTVSEYISTYSDGTAFWMWDKISIDNFRAGTFFDDMESGGIGGQGILVTEENTTYYNENVSYEPNIYWCFPEGNQYAPIPVGNPGSTFDVKMDIRLDNDDSGIYSGWGLCPWPNITKSAVGVSESTIPYDFELGTWYNVEWKAGEGSTTILIDGKEIGTVNGNVGLYDNYTYWLWKTVSIDNISVGSFFEDVEDGEIPEIAQGIPLEEEIEGNRYDLGKYYWCFPAGNSYNPISVNQHGHFNVEMDIRIDDVNGSLKGWAGLAVGPYIGVGGIGIDDPDFAADIVVGEWYHVAYINNGDGTTDIYFDDKYIGTVNEVITTYADGSAFWMWDKISIDNLSIGSYFNDMEDGGVGGQGCQMVYEPVRYVNKFDFIDISEPAGGEALLIESSWDSSETSGYIELPMPTNQFENKYIITYDIAYVQTKESDQGAFLEYWTNWNGGTPVRWAVGTVSGGKGEDQILFDWGEATLDNFHEITFEYDTMKANIYVDGVLFYEGQIGLNNCDLSLSLFCMWYGDAIIDNFQLIDGETYEVVADQSDLPTGTGYNRGSGEMRIVNLDCEDFCAENGCTNGWTYMEYDSTCVDPGSYVTYCAVCGEVISRHEIELKNHDWARYDIDRRTEDGLVYTYCRNGGNCTEKRYVQLPYESTYTGSIYEYHDFSDDFINVMPGGWGGSNWVITDGMLSSENTVSNYNQYDIYRYVNSNDFSVSADMIINGTYDDPELDGYKPEVYFWIGGVSGYAFQIGYNVIDKYVFIRPTNEGAFPPFIVEYEMVNGEKYNFSVNFKLNVSTDGAPPSGRLSVFINGEEIIYTTSRSIVAQQFAKSYTDNLTVDFIIFRNFKTYMCMDNYTIASSDFRWNENSEIELIPGDVNGDSILDADDILLARKYVLGEIDERAIIITNADMNGDIKVNSKDIYLMRRSIAQ